MEVNPEDLKKARQLLKEELKQAHAEDLKKARQILGEKIKRYREGFAVLTQDELARKSGVDRSWIINMEKGHENYTIDELVIVLLKCGVTFQEFLQGLDWTKAPVRHREYHDDLTLILSANSEEIETGIRVNLRAIAKEAVAYKETQKTKDGHAKNRASPAGPHPREAGRDKKNKHAS